jgi:hypothetical protein
MIIPIFFTFLKVLDRALTLVRCRVNDDIFIRIVDFAPDRYVRGKHYIDSSEGARKNGTIEPNVAGPSTINTIILYSFIYYHNRFLLLLLCTDREYAESRQHNRH